MTSKGRYDVNGNYVAPSLISVKSNLNHKAHVLKNSHNKKSDHKIIEVSSFNGNQIIHKSKDGPNPTYGNPAFPLNSLPTPSGMKMSLFKEQLKQDKNNCPHCK